MSARKCIVTEAISCLICHSPVSLSCQPHTQEPRATEKRQTSCRAEFGFCVERRDRIRRERRRSLSSLCFLKKNKNYINSKFDDILGKLCTCRFSKNLKGIEDFRKKNPKMDVKIAFESFIDNWIYEHGNTNSTVYSQRLCRLRRFPTEVGA